MGKKQNGLFAPAPSRKRRNSLFTSPFHDPFSLQRFEGRLSRSLTHLSSELYGQPGHFLLELIQNADDNTYAPGRTPCITFHLTESLLTVSNNEARGFSEADMRALCDVGVSTKVAQRDEKTGKLQSTCLGSRGFKSWLGRANKASKGD